MTPETAPTESPVSVETDDGRILTGMGVSPESLAETMEAREPVSGEKDEKTPPEKPNPTGAAEPSSLDRNEDGTFKLSRGAKRFAAMKAEQQRIEEARQAAEQKAAELEKQLAEYRQAKQAPEPQKAEKAEKPAPTEFNEPEPQIEQFADQADPYAAWNRALARWDRRKEAWEDAQKGADLDTKIAQRFQEVYAQGQYIEQINKVAAEGAQKYQDWQAVVQHPDVANVIFPDDTYRAIVTAPNAAELVYTLAKDPPLARKVASEKDPFRLGVLLGSIRSSQPAVARPASTGAAVASSAPPPYQPVGSGSKTTSPSLSDIADHGDDYDSSGYRERRAAERKGARR